MDVFRRLSADEKQEVVVQAQRIGEIMELEADVTFGHVDPRPHA